MKRLSPIARQKLEAALISGDELIIRGFRPETMVEISLLCSEDSASLILRRHGTTLTGSPEPPPPNIIAVNNDCKKTVYLRWYLATDK